MSLPFLRTLSAARTTTQPASLTRRPARRRALLLTLSALLLVLALSAAPALAAEPPEPPETTAVTAITGTSATFNGILNPGVKPQGGAYQFFYKRVSSGAGCEGESATVGSIAAGLGPEPVFEPVSPLEPNTEYTVCLAARNIFEEQTVGNTVTFKTEALKPSVLSESGFPKATEARLEALVSPNNESTECHFQYGTATVTENEVECEQGNALEGGEQGVGVTVTGLTQGTVYHYRVLLKNATGETQGAEEPLTTAIAPETPETTPASEVAGTTATLNGVLNPANPGDKGTFTFAYRASATECQGEFSAGGEALGATAEAVKAEVKELIPHTTYSFCLSARNEVGEESAFSAPVSFTTPALAPTVDSESVSQVGASSARLAGAVNPQGDATEYRFEYGTSTAYGSSVPSPAASAGAGTSDVPVSVLVEGLSASTTYHYRLVAKNTLGEVPGPDHTFTTQAATTTAGVIDGRSWELVTPPNKHGAPLEMSNNEAGVVQAAQDGSGLSYFTLAPAGENEPAGNRSFAFTQLLSTRTSSGVWGTEDIATPQKNVQGLRIGGAQTEYKLFSSDLSQGLVEPEGATPLSPQATERTPYLRNDHTGVYVPVLPATGLLPAVKFGGVEEDPIGQGGGGGFEEGVEFVTGTADLSHVVFKSRLALTLDSFEPTQGKNLYEWSEGKAPGEAGAVQAVSLIPPAGANLCGVTPPACVPATEAGLGPQLGYRGFDVRNAVSSDGTRLVFETANFGTGGEHHLYLRDVSLGRTLQLDTVQPGVVTPGKEQPRFLDATADGGRVFFADTQRLTTDSSAGLETGPDLYMCQVTVVAGEPHCAVTDLSVSLNEGEPGAFSGADLGIDQTGSQIYFVAAGVLAPGALAGEDNLYVEDTATRATRLVAVLSAEDHPDWVAGSEGDMFSELTSRVSANGRFVTFMSDRPLTGYDNRDVRSGVLDEEVFLYDREAATVRCVSCNPTGARPVGVFDPGIASAQERKLLVDSPGVWEERWLAGSLPGWPLVDGGHALYQPRNLSSTGRVFFDSADALVPTDSNGREDVYEFEPQGVGGCTLPAGCVGLVSSGTSSEESAFMDASGVGPGGEEGEDVFLMTAAKLAPQDVDSAMDVYDAHQCSTAAPCASTVADVPPACSTTDSCRAAPAAQPDVFGAPASATFSGPGNAAPVPPPKGRTAAQVRAEKLARALKQCRRKHNRKQRKACERAAHKAHPARTAGRSPGRARR